MNPIILRSIEGYTPNSAEPDRLVWEGDSSGTVTTSSFSKASFPPAPAIRRFSILWHKWLPPQVSCFIWRVWHRALATNDNVRKLGFSLASRCVCCSASHEESLDHLFIDSELASPIWDFLVPLFRKRRPRSLHQVICYWGLDSDFSVWEDCMAFGLLCCSLWDIWKYRCSFVFGDGQMPRRPGRFSIIRWAACLAKHISIKGQHNRSMDIADCLRLPAPSPCVDNIFWLPWNPHPVGFTCNMAFHLEKDCSRVCAIIRDQQGRFVIAFKFLWRPLTFLSCLYSLVLHVHNSGHLFSCLRISHPDVALLSSYAVMDWDSYKYKRLLARSLRNVLVYRVAPALNIPANALSFVGNPGRFRNLASLPRSVRGRLAIDYLPSPCFFKDQCILLV